MAKAKVYRVLKAFRFHPDRQPHFLFHGNQGATRVPLDKWIKADRKWVQDGSGKTYYFSGFHGFTDTQTLHDWQKTTKTQYIIVPVRVSGTRPKAHSRHKGVILARWLCITKTDWEKALTEYMCRLEPV